jgi:hypothetical protein
VGFPKVRIVQGVLALATIAFGVFGFVQVAAGTSSMAMFILGLVCLVVVVALEPLNRRKGGA